MRINGGESNRMDNRKLAQIDCVLESDIVYATLTIHLIVVKK
jgi:hypothetical protein